MQDSAKPETKILWEFEQISVPEGPSHCKTKNSPKRVFVLFCFSFLLPVKTLEPLPHFENKTCV